MSEPFVGEIRIASFTFAPAGWAFCDGQALLIYQNEALFALIATTYGGDGVETFHLPDLRGRVPLDAGTGLDGILYALGDHGGTERVALAVGEIPSHTHPLVVSSSTGTQSGPRGSYLAPSGTRAYISRPPNRTMASEAVLTTGGNQAHSNLMPYSALNFIIALSGRSPV